MHSLAEFRLGAIAAVVALLPLTLATPVSSETPVLELRRVDPITNCDDKQKAKLLQDFKEVADLADFAGSIDPNHVVFNHYFRIDDLDGAQRMWNALKKVNDGDYTFSVTCAPQGDEECRKRTSWSYAVTDAQPEENGTPRQMKICPKYFTDAQTKRSARDKPYTPRKRGSWCIMHPFKLKDFSIGALTLMHEMTHLDVVGLAAGYPGVLDPEGFVGHGTEDNDLKPLDNPPAQARELRNKYRNGPPPEELLAPYRNAESIAAAALEWWVVQKCQYDDMDV